MKPTISHDLSVKFMISFTISLSCPRLSSFISHDLSARIMISLPRSQSPCYPSSPASRVAKRRPLHLWFSLPVHWQWISFTYPLILPEEKASVFVSWDDDLPKDFRSEVQRLRETLAGKFVLRIYNEERRLWMSIIPQAFTTQLWL